jgi:hypothetical protein
VQREPFAAPAMVVLETSAASSGVCMAWPTVYMYVGRGWKWCVTGGLHGVSQMPISTCWVES